MDFEGQTLMSFKIKDFWWCRKKCMENNECNAITWQPSKTLCTMKKVLPEFKRSKKNGYNSWLFCNGVAPNAGVSC